MDEDILKEFLAESMENLAQLDNEIVLLEKQPEDDALIASIFRTIHTIKGTCGFIGLTGLGAVAHATENVLGLMRDHELRVTPNSISLILEGVDEIKALLHGLETDGREPDRDNARLIQRLDELTQTVQQEVAGPTMAGEVSPPAMTTLESASTPMDTTEISRSAGLTSVDEITDSAKKGVSDLSIRVNVDVLDSLMNLVGELVLTRNQLLQLVRGDDESIYAAPILHLNRVTTDLQEGVMKTRMQPIGNAWGKLPRLVRDLAQQTGKQIELEMRGAETELDRTVLDAIKDPLTHMVRNSADHGLESLAERRAAGKPDGGKIRLNAFHEGGHVIICVDDDGAGIDPERVLRKAIDKGLVSEAQAAGMSEKDIINLVFSPGFSTAEQISSVSGRGVGMDVVKTQIERIGGTVDLTSRRGVGTTVRIKIPLTLAIISALVVESGGYSFAIPQLTVVELVRLAAEDRHKIERINQNEVYRLRDRLLPLVYLDRVLDLDEDAADRETCDLNIVVVQVGDDQFGLIVSEVFDTEEIVVKPVGHLLKDIDIYQGTTIMGDGRVIMILDVAGIATYFDGGSMTGESERQQVDAENDQDVNTTTMLVFDAGGDSLMAVPLSLVSRLEEFPRDRIETTGERMVVQYRDNLLPLLPIHPTASRIESDGPQPVIVFSEGERSMGLLVNEILDIREEPLVIRMPSQRPGVLGTAIINNKATDVIDTQHYVEMADPNWFHKNTGATNKRILIVDDSVFFRQLVTTVLETAGYRVRVCNSAVDAVELIENGQQFDLIVSDIEMPLMDGYEFARWYTQRNDQNRSPLIALTSLSGASLESRAQQAGFSRFLTKLNTQQFLACVQELCHQKERQGVSA